MTIADRCALAETLCISTEIDASGGENRIAESRKQRFDDARVRRCFRHIVFLEKDNLQMGLRNFGGMGLQKAVNIVK